MIAVTNLVGQISVFKIPEHNILPKMYKPQ